MKTYELTYIISPEITSEEAEAFAKEIGSFIQNKEGIILKQANPIAKILSYPIKKHASGFVGVLEFGIDEENLKEIKEKMEKDGKIVRHMIIIKKPAKEYKARRTKREIESVFKKEDLPDLKQEKTEIGSAEEEKSVSVKTAANKEKVELKDIEQKLDEILGE